MKILFVTSEAEPFVSSGGLADVSESLPKCLASLGNDVCVVLPYYACVKNKWEKNFEYITSFSVTLSWRSLYCGVFRYSKNGVSYYFLDNEYYFSRPNVYGDFDDGERFAFFSKAVLDFISAVNFFPDVLHANDWQSALSVVYLKKIYNADERYKNIKTLFTIHNIMYQGRYGTQILDDIIGLPEWAKNDLMLDGDVNFMKGAVQCSDAISTVSPSYKEELLRGENSYRMEFILRERKNVFHGIINGIDTQVYDPSSNSLSFPLSGDVIKFKSENKKELLNELNLNNCQNTPLLAIVSRISNQKGIDIIKGAIEEILSQDVQLVVLGKGDYEDEEYFKYLERKYPEKVRARISFNRELAKRIYAGSDIFLMPSRTEPCGIAQMLACRFGTIPIVRETGGLKDTIKCYNPYDEEDTCGFSFYEYSSKALRDTVFRTLELYKDKKKWYELVCRAMSRDFSFDKSATIYNEVYKRL